MSGSPIDNAKSAELRDLDDVKPYERQTDEPAKKFAAFAIYRDLGASKRSIRAAHAESIKQGVKASNGTLIQWAQQWAWVARARAYDDYLDTLKRKRKEREIARMEKRHADAALTLIGLGIQRIVGRKDENGMMVDKLKLADLEPSDVLRFIVEGAKLERLARGEVESRTETNVSATIDVKPSADRLDSILAQLEERRREDENLSLVESVEVGEGGALVGLAIPSETEPTPTEE